jgi:hypothetical protein
MVEGGGFEPPKASPTDLQSVPFDHSGTPPFHLRKCRSIAMNSNKKEDRHSRLLIWSWRWDLNPQPADYKSAALPIELRQQKTGQVNPFVGKNQPFFSGLKVPFPEKTNTVFYPVTNVWFML